MLTLASDKTPEFEICRLMPDCACALTLDKNHIGLRLPFLLAAFLHPLTLKLVKANQHLNECWKWERILKMRGTINRHSCPKLSFLIGLHIAVSVSSLSYINIQHVATGIALPWKERENTYTHIHADILMTHTHIHPHVSAFVSHTYTLNSLTFSLSHTYKPFRVKAVLGV